MDKRLENAIIAGDLSAVKEYISNSNDIVNIINAIYGHGLTALHLAVDHNHLDIVKYLVSCAQQYIENIIDVKTNYGLTPLHYAVFNNRIEITEFLLNKGANINIKDEDGWNALHFAVESNDIDIVKLLLTHGADREASDNKNMRPIDLTENKEIIILLTEWQDLLEIKEPDTE